MHRYKFCVHSSLCTCIIIKSEQKKTQPMARKKFVLSAVLTDNIWLSNFYCEIVSQRGFFFSLRNILRFISSSPLITFTFSPFLFLLHLLAIFLQLLVCEFVKGVGTLLVDDNLGLVLLFDDGLGCGH